MGCLLKSSEIGNFLIPCQQQSCSLVSKGFPGTGQSFRTVGRGGSRGAPGLGRSSSVSNVCLPEQPQEWAAQGGIETGPC